jgi:hypothetical protein
MEITEHTMKQLLNVIGALRGAHKTGVTLYQPIVFEVGEQLGEITLNVREDEYGLTTWFITAST